MISSAFITLHILIKILLMYVCVCVEVREQLEGIGSLLPSGDSEVKLQVVRKDSSHLYLLRHLAGPPLLFFERVSLHLKLT